MDSMDGIDISQSEAFQQLVNEVRRALDEKQERQTEHRPDLQAEREQLAGQMNGFLQTLGKPDLHPDVRESVEAAMVQLRERLRNLEMALAEQQAVESAANLVVDPGEVQDRLNRLSEVLAGSNASMANLELSLHIDCIRCSHDGKVELRTCRLGALAGAVDLLASGVNAPGNDRPVRPRRRALLRIEDGSDSELRDAADFVADPHRFAGLDERWFHTDVFQIPEPTGWYENHAVEVARQRAEGLTHEQLAQHFGVTVPTIRKALRHAVKAAPSLGTLPKKMPRRQWHVDHVAEVLARHQAGMGVPQMAKHFAKSEPTIRKAMEHAREFGLLDE